MPLQSEGYRSRFRTHVSRQRTRTGSLRESNDLASMICVQPNGSARFHFINVVALPTRHLSGHVRSWWLIRTPPIRGGE